MTAASLERLSQTPMLTQLKIAETQPLFKQIEERHAQIGRLALGTEKPKTPEQLQGSIAMALQAFELKHPAGLDRPMVPTRILMNKRDDEHVPMVEVAIDKIGQLEETAVIRIEPGLAEPEFSEVVFWRGKNGPYQVDLTGEGKFRTLDSLSVDELAETSAVLNVLADIYTAPADPKTVGVNISPLHA